jgi:hypothetical protein
VQQVRFQEQAVKLAVFVTVENIRMKLERQNVKLVAQEHTLPQLRHGTSVKNVRQARLNQVIGKPVVMNVSQENTRLPRASTKNARCVSRESILIRQQPLSVSDAIRININQIQANQSVRLVLLASTQREPQIQQLLEHYLAQNVPLESI